MEKGGRSQVRRKGSPAGSVGRVMRGPRPLCPSITCPVWALSPRLRKTRGRQRSELAQHSWRGVRPLSGIGHTLGVTQGDS